MIRVTISRDAHNNIVACSLSGHASAHHGRDIVCAAVSAITHTTAASIQKLLGIELVGITATGKMEFSLPCEPNESTQLLLEGMLIGIQDVKDLHPKKICIIEKRR